MNPAFAEIVRRYSPRVFHVAHRFFRDHSQAEEAAQETFLKAFAQMKSFAGRGSMEGWLTRIATNTCLNILRAAKRRPELVTSDLAENETEWLERLSDSSGTLASIRSSSTFLSQPPRVNDVRQQTDQRLQKVLTTDQWQKFQQMRSEMRGRRGPGDRLP